MGCSLSSAPEAPRAYVYPVPLNATFDMARGRTLSEAEEALRLTGPEAPRLIFMGEHHGDPRSQAAQLRLLRLLQERGRPVTVALEMFPPQADPALDAWRQGKLTEQQFVEQSRWYETWGFPWRAYRNLFLALRDAHLPLYGINADDATRAAVRENKLDSLTPALREEVGSLDLTVLPHRDYLLDSLRESGHRGSGGEGESRLAPESPAFQRLQRVQVLWDRLMGVRAARLAEAQPPPGVVVVILGSGHVAHGLGANLQAARVTYLPLLSVWDDTVPSESLDAQRRARIPLGMADWVRVYPEDPNLPTYPRLSGVRFVPDPHGVRVETIPAQGGRVPEPTRTPEGKPVLQGGDLVQALNGVQVHSPAELRLRVEDLPWGKPVELALLRAGAPTQVTFTPRSPDSPSR
jgi:uncharacterized iron-regulated protein